MITHDYKLIFIHIPKCAGRSVSEIFNQRFDQFIARHYFDEYKRCWREYDKFTIVRNPYDRLVSIYHYIQQHRRHRHEPIACDGAPFKEWSMQNFKNYKGLFNPNSPEAERGKDYELGSSHWFSPQAAFLGYNFRQQEKFPIIYLYDAIKIFRFEDGFDVVNNYLSEKGVTTKIPHINKSKHKFFFEYYDTELLNFLNEQLFFKEDCAILHYNFLMSESLPI